MTRTEPLRIQLFNGSFTTLLVLIVRDNENFRVNFLRCSIRDVTPLRLVASEAEVQFCHFRELVILVPRTYDPSGLWLGSRARRIVSSGDENSCVQSRVVYCRGNCTVACLASCIMLETLSFVEILEYLRPIMSSTGILQHDPRYYLLCRGSSLFALNTF